VSFLSLYNRETAANAGSEPSSERLWIWCRNALPEGCISSPIDWPGCHISTVNHREQHRRRRSAPQWPGTHRKALEAIIRFAHEQKILPRLIKPEEVFAANTLNLE
jgi:hypothetical protein